MLRARCISHLVALALTLASTLPCASARAQDYDAQDNDGQDHDAQDGDEVTMEVRSADVLDAEVLRDEVERDLGVRVRLVSREGDPRPQVIVEHTPEGTIRLRVRRGDEGALVRETDASDEPGQLTTTVALLVANLVRDESDEVLALLHVQTVPSEAAVPPEEDALEEEEAPTPTEAPLTDVGVGVDFAPALGVSTATLGRDRRHLSFGVLGAWSGQVEGVALSGGVDLVEGALRGLSSSAFLGYAGSVEGAQLAGLLALSDGGVAGLQLGSAAGAARLEGAQLGALAAATTGAMSGLQVGTVTVAGGEARGLQLAVTNVAGASMEGAQIGVVNVAGGGMAGAQLGLVNVTGGRARGVQIGLVNVADEADAQIGLVSVSGNGRTHLRALVDTNGFLGASLVHGGEVTHNIYSVSVEPFLARPTVALGFGLGARARLTADVHLDTEAETHVLFDETSGQLPPDMLVGARLLLGIRLVDDVALLVGLGYRFLLQFDGVDSELGAPILESQLGGLSVDVRGWPAIFAGVELF